MLNEIKTQMVKLSLYQWICVAFGCLIVLEWGWILRDYATFDTRAGIMVQKPMHYYALVDEKHIQTPLFGFYAPVGLDGVMPKASPLHVVLVGVMYAPVQADCRAIVVMPDKKERVVAVGDELADDVVISRIFPEEVHVIRHGVTERLSLIRKTLRFEPPAKPLVEE